MPPATDYAKSITMKILKYLFTRRLAIKPGCFYSLGGKRMGEQKKLFQWQDMPKGYRWF